MLIPRIDRALSECEVYIFNLEHVNPEIVNFLAQSMFIMVYAEFEKQVRILMRERCSVTGDAGLAGYMKNSMNQVIRGISIRQLSQILKYFGPENREEFLNKLEENSRAKTMYENILENRNNLAHGESSQATFSDVKSFYEGGHLVLDYFREALFRRSSGRV